MSTCGPRCDDRCTTPSRSVDPYSALEVGVAGPHTAVDDGHRDAVTLPDLVRIGDAQGSQVPLIVAIAIGRTRRCGQHRDQQTSTGKPYGHCSFVPCEDAILYVVRTGCAWRYLPVDFPPWQTVYGHFTQFNARGTTEWILAELREQVRVAEGRESEPTAGIIDSQSVKGADTVGRDSRGYDAGKKINGRKRFIVTDPLGLLVTVCVLAACWQDRDGAKTTLLSTYLHSPIRHLFADSGFAGRLVDWAAEYLRTTVEIVRKPAEQRGFASIIM
jgi:transposase